MDDDPRPKPADEHAARRARAELLPREQLAALTARNDRDAARHLIGHMAL